MPDNWDAGTITAKFYWTAVSGTSGQTVIWGIQGLAYATNQVLDWAFSAGVAASAQAYTASGRLYTTTQTGAVTVPSAGAGKFVIFQVYRDISDNLAADAKLLAVKIKYGVSSYSD
jgi:hypothetical protein